MYKYFMLVYSVRNKYFSIFGVGIKSMTYDKVDTMIYQPRRSDYYWGQRPRWLSLLGLINNVSTNIKTQQLFY
jgi:hypothetical protein